MFQSAIVHPYMEKVTHLEIYMLFGWGRIAGILVTASYKSANQKMEQLTDLAHIH